MNKTTQWILAGVFSVVGFACFIWHVADYAKDMATGGAGHEKSGIIFNLFMCVTLAICTIQFYVKSEKTSRVRRQTILFSAGSAIWLILSFIDFNQYSHKKQNSPLASEIAAAANQFHKSPPGTKRLEVYVEQLKTIELRSETPADIKQVLADYTATLEEVVIALETGSDANSYKEKLTEEEKRLNATLQ